MTDERPQTLADLCTALSGLYSALGEAILPTAALDRSLARDAARWCPWHEHHLPYGPVESRCTVGSRPTIAVALMATARPDNATRRGVPGSRAPLSGPAMDMLVTQERIWTRVIDVANELLRATGQTTASRGMEPALRRIPALVDALPEVHALRMTVPGRLWALWQRARDVLGLSRSIKWLGECPTTYAAAPFPVLTRDGEVTDEVDEQGGGLRCWTLDLGAMLTDGSGREIWRRSRLAWPRDEEPIRVVCFACGHQPELDSPEISDLVVAAVGGG